MSDDLPLNIQPVLTQLKILPIQLIGKGGEGYVFDVGNGEVIKIYPKSSQKYLESLKNLQHRIAEAHLPYSTPIIERIGEVEGIFYSVEKRLVGQNLETLFSKLNEEQQFQALEQYLAALKPLRSIQVHDLPFGQILDTPTAVHSSSWKTFLLDKLHQKLETSHEKMTQDVVHFPQKLQTLENMIEKMLEVEPEKSFIHGDYYLNNVLADELLNIRAMLDISEHSCIGDYRLDVANINFLPLHTAVTAKHLAFARATVIREYGENIVPYIDLYGFYYAFYFSNIYLTDMTSYKWCLGILNDEKRWANYF